jgi:hypothetical protein
MHRLILRMIVTAVIASLILASGCADSRPSVDSSLTEARVTGIVKLKGKPAAGGGTIVFNPSNVERKVAATTASINLDGTYSLKSYSGGNEVKFSGPFMKDERALALATRYCELKAGDNVVDFDLLGEDDHPRGLTYPRDGGKKAAPRRR